VVEAGRPLPVRDSIIAATALANNLEVVTENTGDFAGVETVNPLKD
jgi:predicted nucleic acid-binding protein